MADLGRCWCPWCKRWVPPEKMNRDYDEDGHLIRVCSWCLEGVETPKSYVHDPHFEDVQCIFCDSYDTVEVEGKNGWFDCRDCGGRFRRLV